MQLQFTPIIMEHWCPSFLLDEIVTTWINFYWVNPKLINSFSLSSHSVFCNIHDIVALALGSHPCELKRFDKIIWYQLPKSYDTKSYDTNSLLYQGKFEARTNLSQSSNHHISKETLKQAAALEIQQNLTREQHQWDQHDQFGSLLVS